VLQEQDSNGSAAIARSAWTSASSPHQRGSFARVAERPSEYLYYRLNVFPIQVPALRERPEDIPLLVRYFVQRFSSQLNKDVEYIPADAMTPAHLTPGPAKRART